MIGYGAFGKLIADVLSKHGEVWIHSRRKHKQTDHEFVSLEKAASADLVILAVELSGLETACKQLAELVSKDTLVVDVCSVKIRPAEILSKNLGDRCRVLPTHPLFGPQTVENMSITGRNIVICPGNFEETSEIKAFLTYKLGLNVIEMSAEEHDKEMAWVHGLTFFVGRGLMKLDPPKSVLGTGYYQKLLDLVELESSHSIELFNTVQLGNPFAAEVRRKLLSELEEINKGLQD